MLFVYSFLGHNVQVIKGWKCNCVRSDCDLLDSEHQHMEGKMSWVTESSSGSCGYVMLPGWRVTPTIV